MKSKVNIIAKVMARVMKKVLVMEVNSNSSFLAFQPKEPKSIEKYLKNEK